MDRQGQNAGRSTCHRCAGVVLAVLALVLAPSRGWAVDTDEADSLEEIVVTATRGATLIRDEPLRVEAVPAQEIAENLTTQPGDLSALLNELPGVRVQSEAPGLGGAGLQLRGMPARNTLVLTDGLPLLGSGPDAFGLLQTPPLDLKQVEVIKGAMSALYGGSAMGGVLNLVSQRSDAQSAILANVTSRGGRDLVGLFTDTGSSGWSGTLTAGAHDQSREDISGAGWADVPGYRRYTLRPRVWWNAGQARSLLLTAGVVDENREGGTLPGHTLPDGSAFAETLHTRRLDGGLVSHWTLDAGLELNGRVSLTSTRQDSAFGAQRVAYSRTTAFGEEALSGHIRGHAWVAGISFEHDALAAATVPGVSYHYNVPAAFVQDEVAPVPWLKLAASARLDVHNSFGTFFSPRLSALFRRPGSAWSVRTSVGGGFSAPTPFVEEIEATSLASLLPLRGLRAERAATESLDIKWADEGWDVNVSLFNSEIREPLQAINAGGPMLELTNSPGPRRAPGAELLVRYVAGPLQLIGSWSGIDATDSGPSGLRQDAPLVPRQSAELALILESEKRGRIGLETGYTGRQAIENDPYRSVGEPYFELNALGEIRFSRLAIFLNAINLTDVRQTHFDPLVRPTPGPGGNPITDVWAPLDGRRFNIGIRVRM
jgi:outer membrane receptor for ferrienterochelin and colicins